MIIIIHSIQSLSDITVKPLTVLLKRYYQQDIQNEHSETPMRI